MIAIGIRYLCGWSMATEHHDYERPEWPPHPDRVFMALVAAHKTTAWDPSVAASEREALAWLEQQGLPGIQASPAVARTVTKSYVPVNDTGLPSASGEEAIGDEYKDWAGKKLGLLPAHRNRKGRVFPVCVPESDTVHLIWPDADPSPSIRDALSSLCRKVTNVGHSASLVQAYLEDQPLRPTHMPDRRNGTVHLRVTGAGRLAELEARYLAGLDARDPRGNRRPRVLRPSPAPTEPYRICREEGGWERCPEAETGVFSPHLVVFRLEGERPVPITGTLRVVEAFRGLLMSKVASLPEWLSGHKPGGEPSQSPHAAILPLANVGFPHSDGRIFGLGLALPRAIGFEALGDVLGSFVLDEFKRAQRHRLVLGRQGAWDVAVDMSDVSPVTLRPETWTHAARKWGTVTPIVLDRHPKRNDDENEFMEATIADSVERIGLPRPLVVVTMCVSPHPGVSHQGEFPALKRKGGSARRHTHAVLVFDRPVAGPLLVGAGRYRGYGLLRQLEGGTIGHE
jgi:CRISPR-associated protein Csb2